MVSGFLLKGLEGHETSWLRASAAPLCLNLELHGFRASRPVQSPALSEPSISMTQQAVLLKGGQPGERWWVRQPLRCLSSQRPAPGYFLQPNASFSTVGWTCWLAFSLCMSFCLSVSLPLSVLWGGPYVQSLLSSISKKLIPTHSDLGVIPSPTWPFVATSLLTPWLHWESDQVTQLSDSQFPDLQNLWDNTVGVLSQDIC